jgi:proteasome lid subunit RPN8/RPN11
VGATSLAQVEQHDGGAPVGIPARVLNELCEHARASDPEECCGLVVSEGPHRYGRVVRCRNVMTQRHREDPLAFPRDNTAAYYMSESDVIGVAQEAERTGAAITAVYHSHVGAAAYLSDLDLAYARHGLFPFPDADQIVLSVLEQRVSEMKIFLRSGESFVERLVEAEPG